MPHYQHIAVLHPRGGIGDMLWYLPHNHALAKHFADAKLTVIAKPSSKADVLLAADPHIDEVLWIYRRHARARPDKFSGDRKALAHERRGGRHDGWLGFIRLVLDWRAQDFDAIFIFHRSWRYALAAHLAGIPNRYGFGYKKQRRWLNQAHFLPAHAWQHPAWHQIKLASRFLNTCGIDVPSTQPQLTPNPKHDAWVAQQLQTRSGPFVVLGIGSSAKFKQWGCQHFTELARHCVERYQATLILAGGPEEADIQAAIELAVGADKIISLLQHDIGQGVALINRCRCYVGNDSGFLNIACSLKLPTIGLFGGTPVLYYSAHILAITPPPGSTKYDHRGESETGMANIEFAEVWETLQTVLDAG